ncbi:recombinase family protein [Dysosmobacter sp.]
MIRAAREGKIDLIITKEVSRFARNTVDTLEYTRELRRLGVGVLFLLDGINTLDADGELRLTIMASMAQEESRKTSGRVKWGQKRRMEQGVVFGGSLLGYDVADGKMTVNPEGAKIVRYIFHKYLNERKGSSIIAKELRDEGIQSSRGNVKWSAPTVLKILKNEKYCGDLVQKKTYTPDFLSHGKKYNKGQEDFVVLRDHHEPIIDRETWDAVQRELHRRHIDDSQSSGHGNRYPLSGKIKCGDCGSSFMARKKKRQSGAVYKVWRCGKTTTQGKRRTDASGAVTGCDVGRQLREDVAMDILRQAVKAVQMDREGITGSLTRIVEGVLKDSQDEIGPEKRRLERELEGEQEKKEKALSAYFDATISKKDLQFMNQRCDARIAQLQGQITAIEKRQALDTQSKGARKDIRAAIRGIVSGETADDDFYGHLLHHMTVYNDGRVEVALNLLPARWYFLLDGLAEYHRQMAVHGDSSVPISVSSAFSSGYGMV